MDKRIISKSPLWWIKLTNYEYWSWSAFYLPIMPVLLWNAIRARSFTFFSAVNPGIEGGGLVGSSKKRVLDRIPDAYKPFTMLIAPEQELTGYTPPFPFIAKPDIGERGAGVTIIHDNTDWVAYHAHTNTPYIIQEYIDYPIELGVFYSKKDNEVTGRISSVTLKEFLFVTGNGTDTLGALINSNTRARFHLKKLRKKFEAKWNMVLPNGQKLELESIGNHSRGTRFVNANYLINNQLEQVFEHISAQIQGFQYGRFDLRVRSLYDLYAGSQIRIMELNGVNSEPGHIYDSSVGLIRAYKDLIWHWNRITDISILNQKNGVQPVSLREMLDLYRKRKAVIHL